MNKTELIEKIAAGAGLSKADAKKALKHSAEIYSAAGRKELAEKSLELLKSLE